MKTGRGTVGAIGLADAAAFTTFDEASTDRGRVGSLDNDSCVTGILTEALSSTSAALPNDGTSSFSSSSNPKFIANDCMSDGLKLFFFLCETNGFPIVGCLGSSESESPRPTKNISTAGAGLFFMAAAAGNFQPVTSEVRRE